MTDRGTPTDQGIAEAAESHGSYAARMRAAIQDAIYKSTAHQEQLGALPPIPEGHRIAVVARRDTVVDDRGRKIGTGEPIVDNNGNPIPSAITLTSGREVPVLIHDPRRQIYHSNPKATVIIPPVSKLTA